MALSETMSGSNDWFQIYQQNFPVAQVMASVSDAVAVTAVSASTTQGSVGIPNSSPANTSVTNIVNNSLSPEGKIAKPVRRRSRASRRTPTTLLNTDTTNFRAMVQQFTGDPSAPFAVSRMPNLGFGVAASRQPQVNPNAAAIVTPSFHLQQQQQLYQQQNHQQQQQQNHQYMFSMNNNSNANNGGRFDFYQRRSNPNSSTATIRPSNNESSMTSHDFAIEHHGGGRFFPNTSSS